MSFFDSLSVLFEVDGGVDGEGWECDCENGYECVEGCDAPHEGHTCKKTPEPTPMPTPEPTVPPRTATQSILSA